LIPTEATKDIMNDATQLPTYPNDELANLDLPGLVNLMTADEDRVPRNVIDECARRGDTMVEQLSGLVDDSRDWYGELSGEWWLKLHAVMILGLIPTERAGLLLVKLMRRMSREEDTNLQGWLAGRWPALFRNKPESVFPALRALCEDRATDWYIRVNAIETYVATQHGRGNDALEQSLQWLAGIAADEQEDWEVRLLSGNDLLDFPRPQYRPLLENLASLQSGLGVHFNQDDVERAYASASDKPGWEHFKDPWRFYTPEEITARQERWAKEDAKREANEFAEDYDEMYFNDPYVREMPKVGRNDPCPCGSGKKYKKCCLLNE
jgi:hypothetical protein